MNNKIRWRIWDNHIDKIYKIAGMIEAGALNFSQVRYSGYSDEVVDGILDKLEVDLRALDNERL
jgi:hypothetical protein